MLNFLNLTLVEVVMTFKLTSWNIEHSSRLIGSGLSPIYEERRKRVKNTILDINPDILCMIEGPKGTETVAGFCESVLENKWRPVLLKPDNLNPTIDDKSYKTSGTQWIWFLVRENLLDKCRLQPPSVWQSYNGVIKWNVHYWGDQKSTKHGHYRHPQVLIFDMGQGHELEVIGLHMKSKINKKPLKFDTKGNVIGDYLTVALKARVKLATEARNVRQYIEKRFEQEVSPAIIIMGDANDGVGQDHFEQNYLFFDLVSNLQGNIMRAERFFNHALFDYPEHLRWSAKYRNKIKKIPASKNPLLIDHILMSQALVNGSAPLQAGANAGFVEHEAYDRGNAGASKKKKSSDHRPVSLILKSQNGGCD